MSTFFLILFLMLPGEYNTETGVYSGKALYRVVTIKTDSVGRCNMIGMKEAYKVHHQLLEDTGKTFRVAHKCIEFNDV